MDLTSCHWTYIINTNMYGPIYFHWLTFFSFNKYIAVVDVHRMKAYFSNCSKKSFYICMYSKFSLLVCYKIRTNFKSYVHTNKCESIRSFLGAIFDLLFISIQIQLGLNNNAKTVVYGLCMVVLLENSKSIQERLCRIQKTT